MAGVPINSKNIRNAHQGERALRAQEKRQERLGVGDPNARTEGKPRVWFEPLADLPAAEIARRIAESGSVIDRNIRKGRMRRERG